MSELTARSPEFRDVWSRGEVGVRPRPTKRFVHHELGLLELECQTLLDRVQSHALLVCTAAPGSESAGKLRLLTVIGAGS
ncbi:hypothetical protein SK224_06530 [Microbacterium sp. BG28]|uniref:MmyB family transcriptional regulator n=1 Tax=Microbacterium sp. BG28 TaxID=3097356 RepID=UPI002A5A77B6|nr:hypothetical protein [Microbacterium sp. BG28]MDY0828782.1 hypothetical protein [Microbacterium sp. BG28]